jgi:hypothetical protein
MYRTHEYKGFDKLIASAELRRDYILPEIEPHHE